MKPIVGVTCLGLLTATWAWWVTNTAPAQPAAPPGPAAYQVILRYRILAPRDQHALIYDDLVAHLKGLNFEFQPPLKGRPATDRIDPNKNEFRGRLAATQVPRLRDNPNVAGILLLPEGFKPPDDPDQPLRVRIELASGLTSDRQHDLADQTKLLLGTLGFKEAIGYDHRGAGGRPFTRLMGTVPAGQLDVLLKDLRTQPSGWFAPQIAQGNLPTPLRDVNPISYTEVLNDPEPIKDVAEPAARSPEYLDKIGTGLWELVNDKEKEGTQVRVQVLFAGSAPLRVLKAIVERTAPSAIVEGVAGSYVTAELVAGQAKALAALPEVLAVRLPVPARIDVAPDLPAVFEPAKVLERTGLSRLHQQKKLGQGIRLAILDTDFRGWEEQVKSGKLPASTRLVDVTAETSVELVPAPPAEGAGLGHGTQCAIAAAVAAPGAELVLIRIAGDEPRLILDINQALRGGPVSASLERRLDELHVAGTLLALKHARLLKERGVILEGFRDEEELRQDFGFLGPVYGWIFSEREWHRQQISQQRQLEQDLAARERRYWKLIEQLQSLKGIPLIVCALGWNDGYPLGGASALSRGLEEPAGPLWFQAAGNTAGQAWTGTYRDVDGNGAMEFTEPGAKLPPGRWTSEVSFLAWQPFAGKLTADLPEKAALRFSLQWREPHDPDYYLRPGEEDAYRRPLADMRLVLLRQRDPDGKTVGADAMDVVARSRLVPGRLDHQPGGTVYEQVLEYTVDTPGRYALRVEHSPMARWTLAKLQDRHVFELRRGLIAGGIRPLDAATFPALEKTWELRPRLFVEATDDGSRRQGRPVFIDFATASGSIGTPADARSVITVGAAKLDGLPQPYSGSGSPAFVDLRAKPSVWTYDALRHGQGGAWGTSLAASYAAGTAATLLSAGLSRDELLELIRQSHNKVLRAGE